MAGWLIAVIVVVCVVALVAIVVAVVMIRSHRRSRPAEELPVADGAPPATTPEAAAPGGGLRNSLKSVTVLRNSGNAGEPIHVLVTAGVFIADSLAAQANCIARRSSDVSRAPEFAV
eukprot:TRINITY_DN743_c0_g1_i3.p2 TRINITY_DN743_c0_g1~~TRINITY_DN743_c0_g1_i3.p2  ORF type:complete len:117 (-),score=16.49 TRINITY_DN743_c0_g1_i3:269-619(-)